MNTQIYAQIHESVWIYIHTHIHTHTYIHTYTHTHTWRQHAGVMESLFYLLTTCALAVIALPSMKAKCHSYSDLLQSSPFHHFTISQSEHETTWIQMNPQFTNDKISPSSLKGPAKIQGIPKVSWPNTFQLFKLYPKYVTT
jgi:hypothetical protein